MKLGAAGWLLFALLAAGCGGNGATKFESASPTAAEAFGSCAFCHIPMATNMLTSGRDLRCETCHDDRIPGNVGPGHRSIPGPDRVPSFVGPTHQPAAEGAFGSCSFCHNQFAMRLVTESGELKCQTCHDNRLPGVFGPGHRAIPGPDRVPSFAGPTHDLGAQASFGSCALCHNQFALNITAAGSELKCQTCHDNRLPGVFGPGHRAIPGPDRVPSFVGPTHDLGAEISLSSCAFCHNQFAANIVAAGGEPKCVVCHDDRLPGVYGPGHRSIPGADRVPSFAGPAHDTGAQRSFGSCAFCHNQFTLNIVAAGGEPKCVVCHDDRLPGVYGPGHRVIPGTDRVPSFAGPAHDTGAQISFGSCAFCHNQFAANIVAAGGEPKCVVCHDDRLPGVYGPSHRSIPGTDRVPSFAGPTHSAGAQVSFGACAFCHNQFARNITVAGGEPKCAVCHDDRLPGVYGPGHRSIPGTDRVPSFAGPAHDTGVEAAFGSCAFCHNQFAVNITAAGGEPKCVVCHDDRLPGVYGPGHRNIPGVDRVPSFVGPTHRLGAEARFGKCAFCHNELAVKASVSTHGDMTIECARCHTEQLPGEFGPGHQSIPRCADCHSGKQTHNDPDAGTRFECAVCHTPHGSDNLFLIREQVVTPSGTPRDVVFDNRLGLTDGSFASVSQPGTGVCETCHTATRFYRSDGTGDRHVPYPCFTCHQHALGFAPR